VLIDRVSRQGLVFESANANRGDADVCRENSAYFLFRPVFIAMKRSLMLESVSVLAGLNPGDEVLVRRLNGRLHVFTTMTVSQVKETFLIARQSMQQSKVPGRGVVCFRLSDGVEQASGGAPRRAWPLDSDEAQHILEKDPSARRQIERQRR
jgi:hypothetical protein